LKPVTAWCGVVLALLACLLACPVRADEHSEIEAALVQGRAAVVLPELHRLADAGDPEAAFNLGLLYDIGHGVRQDWAAAMGWYKQAAVLGHPTATFNVGVMYDAGRGVAQDPTEAARWYRRAADLGIARADYNLGLMYLRGDGVKRDPALARRYFQAAERRGVGAAESHLASLDKAEDPAGEHAFALVEAQILEHGLVDLDSGAIGHLSAAARKGNALAEYDLGYCYEHGIGLAADRVAALAWYTRAAHASGPTADASRPAATAATNDLQARLTAAEQRAAAILKQPPP
jgi:TPR repeat protein